MHAATSSTRTPRRSSSGKGPGVSEETPGWFGLVPGMNRRRTERKAEAASLSDDGF